MIHYVMYFSVALRCFKRVLIVYDTPCTGFSGFHSKQSINGNVQKFNGMQF